MFCKWCGETVNPAQRKCANCGRELPALSDCGGFYDLVPAARPAEPVRERPEREPMRPPVPSKPPKRGASGGLTAAVLILLAVSLLFQVFAFFYLRGHLPEQSATTDGALQAQISELIAELKGNAPNRDSGGTPESVSGASGFPSGGAPEEPPENRSYTFLHDASDHTEQSDTGEWLPKYSEDELQVEYRQKDGAGFTAELTWEADDDGWEITASYDLKDEKGTFGVFRSGTAEWELYDEATDAWGALPDGVLTVHPSEGNEFSCTVSKAVFPESANGEVAQIRCLITRENEAGGKMTIILGNALLRSEDAD